MKEINRMNILGSKTYRDDLDKVASALDLTPFAHCSFLITGGLGLIGSTIVDFLTEYEIKTHSGIHIIVAARNKVLFQEKYNAFSFISFLPYEALDCFSFEGKVDYIIHGAGVASPEKYLSSPVETMLSNIVGINNILKYCSHTNIKRVLYISSSEVYGILNSEDSIKENNYGTIDIDSIRSSYPIAKKSAEMLCRSYANEYNIDSIIVRPGHIYGPSASEKDNRVSSCFAYKAARGESLFLKSSGRQKRSYLYSPDCVKAILIALLKGTMGEAYNIGAETDTTIREMAEHYAIAGGVPLSFAEPVTNEIKSFNPMSNSSLNIEKIRQLGYHDTFTVEEGFKHTVQIIKESI